MTISLVPRLAPAPPFRVHRAFWGTVVRAQGGPPILLQVAQGMVLAFGGAFAAGALALVLPPGAGAGAAPDAARGGMATVLISLSLLLLWFATRGGVVELQFDRARGELRELVRHRVGRATLVARHGLGDEAALLVDRARSASGRAALVLRLPGQDSLCIAEGPEDAILALRRRLDPELRRAASPSRPTLAA